MKNYLSVFSLYIKSSFTKISALLLLMVSAQTTSFLHTINNNDLIVDIRENQNYLLGAEFAFKYNKPFTLILIVGFLLIYLILCLMGSGLSSKEGYTLRRLNISEKETLICHSLYGIFCYGIFIIVEAILLFTLCLVYINFAKGHEYNFDGFLSNQTLFLAFYRNNLLHGFMPLDDILKHISNLTAIIAMGISTAAFPYFTRRKKLSFESFILIPVILLNFTADWTEMTYDLIIMGVSIFVIGIIITRISLEGQAYDR